MMWKREGIRRVFDRWESLWRRWITPQPFQGEFGDPDPLFHGSAFCIEQ